MVGMGMAYKNRGNLFPAKVKAAERNLSPFAAVEQKQITFPPEQYRSKMTAGQRHHSA
jgi:hypothetical protein